MYLGHVCFAPSIYPFEVIRYKVPEPYFMQIKTANFLHERMLWIFCLQETVSCISDASRHCPVLLCVTAALLRIHRASKAISLVAQCCERVRAPKSPCCRSVFCDGRLSWADAMPQSCRAVKRVQGQSGRHPLYPHCTVGSGSSTMCFPPPPCVFSCCW